MANDCKAAGEVRRLFVFNAGFFTRPRLNRILSLAGWKPTVGLPSPDSMIGV